MLERADLWGFIAVAVVAVVIPGPNTLLVLAHSLAGGRATGLATALGIETGTLVHTLFAALGLSAILARSPLAFDVVKYGGAAWLASSGLRAMRQAGAASSSSASAMTSLTRAQAYRRAVQTNVTNPKVALFFLALLPQFVRPERGHLVLQFLLLGTIAATVGFLFECLIALAAGAVGARLRESAQGRWPRRLTGGVLIALALHVAFIRHG
jgi:threonine/homoserine/homoserine lactone efflux protein